MAREGGIPRVALAPLRPLAFLEHPGGAAQEAGNASRYEVIAHEVAIPTVIHDPVGAKHGQMPRDGRLVGAHQRGELARATLPLGEPIDDQQAGLMREGLEHAGLGFVGFAALDALARHAGDSYMAAWQYCQPSTR